MTAYVAAIDVGSNAARLVIARVGAGGSLTPVLVERDPIRPGEGVFQTGLMGPGVVDRLIAVLTRFALRCRSAGAEVRAVATSPLRAAGNRDHVIDRVRARTGLTLEVISGAEEARLVCLGVLGDAPGGRAAVIDIGGGSAELAAALGDRPTHVWTAPLGGVLLSERFPAVQRLGAAGLSELRAHTRQVARAHFPA